MSEVITKKLVISNHANHDLEWIKMTYDYGFSPENTVIYDRTPDDFPEKHNISHLGEVIKSPNVGSNPYDIGRYIVDHYDNLPDTMIFIKGNLLQKEYTTKERFIYALNANWFVPIDRGNLHPEPPHPFLVNDDWFSLLVEGENKHWTIFSTFQHDLQTKLESMVIYPRIKTFIEFMKDIFIIEEGQMPKYISFAPGANYVVPKNVVLKYSKNFYKKIIYYTNYDRNPIEAHWFERIFQLMWQGCLEENRSYTVL